MSQPPPNLRLPFEDPEQGPELADAADRAAAVDPRRNIVLEASAGTGKTRVLVERYLNLLEAGVQPRNILAITFTRKAAAEMRERIVTSLRRSAETGAIDPARWRDLRDQLGEIAVSTIDAFCLSLLREFPLEADLEPGFEMADETDALRLVGEALDRAVVACRAAARSDPGLELLFAHLGEPRLRSGLSALLERRLVAHEALRRFLGGRPAQLTMAELTGRTLARVRDVLRSVEGGLEAFLADGPLEHPRFALLAHDVRQIMDADPADSAEAQQQIRLLLDGLKDHFLTTAGEPRKRWTRYTGAHAASPDGWRRHQQRARSLAPEIARLLAAFRRDLNVVLSRGVWRAFHIAAQEYRRTLERHAVVDFTEALWRTLQLLEQMGEFAQSRYVLEARYQHLLVDEFQDTSQAQWELVWRLVQAWGEGAGVADEGPLAPTIFVVGDRKQSIYGFRDADVGLLGRAASAIGALRPGGSVRRAIRRSFRAAPGLLAFVNDVFDSVPKADRADAFRYEEQDRFPVDPGAVREPVVGVVPGADLEACAAAVADEISLLLASGRVRDKGTGVARAVQTGDIAVLFRSRDGHQAFEAALESRGVPAYVYKGLGFYDADEIKDVFALLRYLADPVSPLRAAALARSRFLRLSDAALQALAPVLADSLRWPVPEDEALDPEDRAVLSRGRMSITGWLSAADRVPPADLLDRILRESAYLFETAGPRAAQARENLKKVRGLVRRVQNRGYATVSRVAEHLDRLSTGDESNAAIDAAGSVHLMTVHAAKGLEFPIVFLVHLAKGTGGTRPPIRLVSDAGQGEPSVSIGDFVSDADGDQAARDLEETKRLLYVAMTRARDRLYLSAIVGERLEPARGSLAQVLPESLQAVLGAAARAGYGTELTWTGPAVPHRIRVVRAIAGPIAPVRSSGPAAHDEDYVPLADAASVPRLMATELVEGTGRAHPRAGPGEGHTRAVGSLVHWLLQRGALDPVLSEGTVAAVAAAGIEPSPDPATIGAALGLYHTIVSRPAVAALLRQPEQLVEVPFSLRTEGAIVRGTIDRLVRDRDGGITVIEFKTGAPAPEHHAQIEMYLEAARALFPGCPVSGLIVYPGEEHRVPAEGEVP